MTVTLYSLAAKLNRPVNDPELAGVYDAATSWARTELSLPDDDDLSILKPHNEAAIYGYAGDLLKLPKAQFGYFDGGGQDEAALVAVGDIARRWRQQLCFGVKVLWGVA